MDFDPNMPMTSEGILEYVKRSRITQDNNRVQNTDNALRGAIQSGSNGNTEFNVERERTTRNISNGNGNSENYSTSEHAINNNLRSIISETGRSDNGADTNNRSDGTITRVNSSPIKSRFKPFMDNVKKVIHDTQPAKKPATKKVEQVKRLTELEIKILRPKLIDGILWQTEHMDDLIQATTKNHNEVSIWSNIDITEAEILADFLISRGKANPKMATVVREISTLMDKIKLGMILIPRAYKTMSIYLERGFSIK